MAANIKIGNYSKKGFWYLAFRKTFVGFCADVQSINAKVVGQEEMITAWSALISKLDAEWVESDGSNVSKEKQDLRLIQAMSQTKGDTADKYWRRLSEKRGDPTLLEASVSSSPASDHHSCCYEYNGADDVPLATCVEPYDINVPSISGATTEENEELLRNIKAIDQADKELEEAEQKAAQSSKEAKRLQK